MIQQSPRNIWGLRELQTSGLKLEKEFRVQHGRRMLEEGVPRNGNNRNKGRRKSRPDNANEAESVESAAIAL
jgi:hypothetical protein